MAFIYKQLYRNTDTFMHSIYKENGYYGIDVESLPTQIATNWRLSALRTFVKKYWKLEGTPARIDVGRADLRIAGGAVWRALFHIEKQGDIDVYGDKYDLLPLLVDILNNQNVSNYQRKQSQRRYISDHVTNCLDDRSNKNIQLINQRYFALEDFDFECAQFFIQTNPNGGTSLRWHGSEDKIVRYLNKQTSIVRRKNLSGNSFKRMIKYQLEGWKFDEDENYKYFIEESKSGKMFTEYSASYVGR